MKWPKEGSFMRKKKAVTICIVCIILCITAICGCTQTKIDPEKIQVPEDFAFSITWNVYGISSYDSKTGTLIKTTDATHPENYITTLNLSEETLKKIYIKLTKEIDLYSYKNEYNPFSFVSQAENNCNAVPNTRTATHRATASDLPSFTGGILSCGD